MENNTIKDFYTRINVLVKRLNSLVGDLTDMTDTVTELSRQCYILEENLFGIAMGVLEDHLRDNETMQEAMNVLETVTTNNKLK